MFRNLLRPLLLAFSITYLGVLAMGAHPAYAQNYSVNTGCFDPESPEYSSTTCAESRNNPEHMDEYEKYCNTNREETGMVWVKFSQQCISFTEFGGLIVRYLLTFASVIAGIMFVVASFKYLTSKGDPAALSDAKDMLINATIGIVIIASALVIIQILDSAFTLSGDPINVMPFFDLF